MKLHRLNIHLAGNEYGNGLMANLANESAAEHTALWPLLITVHEHGGWFLQWFYSADHPQVLIVGSANDGAAWTRDQFYARQSIASASEVVTMPSVHR